MGERCVPCVELGNRERDFVRAEDVGEISDIVYLVGASRKIANIRIRNDVLIPVSGAEHEKDEMVGVCVSLIKSPSAVGRRDRPIVT